MLKFYLQVLLRSVNSYISKFKTFSLFRFVNVKKKLNPDSTEKVRPKKHSEETFEKWIGDKPNFFCPNNIIVTYPRAGFGPEIIFGLRIFDNYEGKTIGTAYNLLLTAILVNVKNHPDSANKPFLFAYLFKRTENTFNVENLYLYSI